MQSIKFTDKQISQLVRSVGLDARRRILVKSALEILAREYNPMSEDRFENAINALKDARLISSSQEKRIIDSWSTYYEKT